MTRWTQASFILCLLIPCCHHDGSEEGGGLPAVPSDIPTVANPKLAQVDDFCYVLDGPDLDAIAATEYDLAVIDYSQDGSEAGAFTPAQIAELKQSTGDKVVLAYLSIGEAEDYRFYWQLRDGVPGADWVADPPRWLGPENPDFPGNHKVRFWDPEWQQIIISNPGGHPVLADQPSFLDRLLAQGFDGVFLDVIDAFEFFGPLEDGGNGERPTAAADMAAFVVAIAAHARLTVPDFIVCQQNGENLISPELAAPLTPSARDALLTAVDHLSLEDVIYRGDADENNPFAPALERIREADQYRLAGKLVTIIDYFDAELAGYEMASVDDFFALSRAREWVPYTGPRALDRLVLTPGQQPD